MSLVASGVEVRKSVAVGEAWAGDPPLPSLIHTSSHHHHTVLTILVVSRLLPSCCI